MVKPKKQDLDGAIIYARYSSHNQREVSIDQQILKCREYAELNGLTILHIYTDKAISGKTDKRAGFQQMMHDAAKGKFTQVIAWKSNRMGRNMLDAMMNDARLAEMGIRCFYVEEDFDDTAAGRFALRSMMNVNQFYSENMAEDIMRGLEFNAEKCMVNGSLPLGYKKSATGQYEIDEPNAAVVKEIFERAAEREHIADIANDLNSRGIKTAQGKPWGKNSFHRMLSNERYKGIYIWHNKRIENGIPRIISDSLFDKVQEVVSMRSSARKSGSNAAEYLLSGKLFCGHCNSIMHGVSGTGKLKAKHYYYVCSTRRREHTCEKQPVRKNTIEDAVVNAITENLFADGMIEWMLDSYDKFIEDQRQNSLMSSYLAEINDIEKAIANILKAIEMGIITETTKSRMIELEQEKKDLQRKIATEEALLNDLTRDQVEFWLRSFANGDTESPAFRERLIKTFVDKIYLFDDHLKIYCNYTGNKTPIKSPIAEAGDSVRPDAPSPHQSSRSRTPQANIYICGLNCVLEIKL